jgi:hypothetical protein
LVEIACQHVLGCFGGPSPQTQPVGAANLIGGGPFNQAVHSDVRRAAARSSARAYRRTVAVLSPYWVTPPLGIEKTSVRTNGCDLFFKEGTPEDFIPLSHLTITLELDSVTLSYVAYICAHCSTRELRDYHEQAI